MEKQLDKDSETSETIYPTVFMFAGKKRIKIKFNKKTSGWILAMESSKKV